MWQTAPLDVDANMALQWLWGSHSAFRLATFAALPMPLTFVDVETTRDRIVEIATVRFDRQQPPAVFHSYVNPGLEGWSRSPRYWNTEIHGLTDRQVQRFPEFRALLPALNQQFAGACIAAHNVSFERRFLSEAYQRVGLSWSRPELCTLKLARALLPDRASDGGSHRLEALASGFHIRNPAPHRAIGDTITTIWVLLAMIEAQRGDASLSRILAEVCTGVGGRPRNAWTDPYLSSDRARLSRRPRGPG